MLDEGREQVELATRQCDLAPVGGGESTRREIELPVGEAVSASIPGRYGVVDRPGSPQYRLDSRQQLAQVEGLGHVVVGADLEADDLVDSVAATGDDDQPAPPVLAQLTGDRKSVFARKAEIEQHQR